MEYYEMAYETEEKGSFIIPHLLQEDRPDELPDFPSEESLILRYKSEQPLPPQTISRLIVRLNRDIKRKGNNYQVWRYGVVLEDKGGNLALVREEDRTITVSVKGVGKTNYFSILRETLNDIFNSYKSRKPLMDYRVENLAGRSGETPVWMPETIIKIISGHKNHLFMKVTKIRKFLSR
jgi:hypothetical protein